MMLNRWMPTFEMLGIPNAFQFVYHNDKSRLLASFVLQEMKKHNVDGGSKDYYCFLDSMQKGVLHRLAGRTFLCALQCWYERKILENSQKMVW
jgi:hypothetical protein